MRRQGVESEGKKIRGEGLKKGENRWMDTDTPAQGKADNGVMWPT